MLIIELKLNLCLEDFCVNVVVFEVVVVDLCVKIEQFVQGGGQVVCDKYLLCGKLLLCDCIV